MNISHEKYPLLQINKFGVQLYASHTNDDVPGEYKLTTIKKEQPLNGFSDKNNLNFKGQVFSITTSVVSCQRYYMKKLSNWHCKTDLH